MKLLPPFVHKYQLRAINKVNEECLMSYSKLRVIVLFIYYSLSTKLFIIMRHQNEVKYFSLAPMTPNSSLNTSYNL